MVSLIDAPEKQKDDMRCETSSTSRQGDRNYNQDRYGVARREDTFTLLLADGPGTEDHSLVEAMIQRGDPEKPERELANQAEQAATTSL